MSKRINKYLAKRQLDNFAKEPLGPLSDYIALLSQAMTYASQYNKQQKGSNSDR
ncbi:MAG: hypothetical protein GX221_09310 [Candidatus Riflebacteria bacterium]|nr:hypothetical protein [Candidatus Riflebacteria bacterium]